jgi:phosphoribosylglycinamide formyltransferase 1
MTRIAVFASGQGSNFEALVAKAKSYKVVCLIVDQADAYAIQRSIRLNIPYYVFIRAHYSSKKAFEKAIFDVLERYQVQWIALAGYMRMIGSLLLHAYPNRILNIHPSLLPAFPGKTAIQDAFQYGVKITGVTIFLIDIGMDTGKIIAQEALAINPQMTYSQLEAEIHRIEHQMYGPILEKWIGEHS